MVGQQTSESRARKLWRAVGLLTLAVVACLCITVLANAMAQGAKETQETHDWVQKIARFTFPPSADIQDATYIGMQGWTANTKFTMAPSELDQFIQSTPITPPLKDTGLPRGICTYKLDNSTPHLFGDYYESQGPNGYLRLSIFVDVSNPKRYTVYLCAAGD